MARIGTQREARAKRHNLEKSIRDIVRLFLLAWLIASPANAAASSPRTRHAFNKDWKFLKQAIGDAEVKGVSDVGFDDSTWEPFDLPHDWGIEGPFTREVPSAEGRRPFPGVGWYRKTFKAPPKGKHVFIEFDGVMRYAQVWLNGEYVGGWPYGYSSFAFELTRWLKYDGDNVLTVRCENEAYSSRWYPGAGIYRNVWLTVVEPIHIAHWGTYVSTPEVSDEETTLSTRYEIQNQSSDAHELIVETTIVDAQGTEIAVVSTRGELEPNASRVFDQRLKIKKPIRWDITNPYLYTAVTRLETNGEVKDEYHTPFGIRTFRFDAREGFFLNGRSMKIHGVNLHHGLGPLGTAVNRRAIERQLEIMKSMGCNAVRTAHNPPAPEQLALCDELGLLVMDEAFDEWFEPKVPNGYHVLFEDWAEKDLRAMVRRDRNHPSIILWSIGNEIVGLESENGAETARRLADVCREEDPVRPVTIGNSAPYNKTAEALKTLDVVGWNYRSGTGEYDEPQRREAGLKQIATETCAVVSSRGEYLFPVGPNRNVHRNGQVSSYDLTNLSFGGLPDEEFRAQEQFPWIAGEFVWSGFDYLGEPEPCEFQETARSTYFGIVDMCGFPKDRYYLYQSQWTDKPMVHLLPHWNWPGREGEVTPVFVYTNGDSAELFLNGKSLGVKQKKAGVYRLKWEEVKYQPGTINAVAYDKDGKALCSKAIRTAGEPARIELSCDRTAVQADGQDLAFVTVRILDKDGNLCPTADNLVQFTLDGPAEIAAVGNGNAMSFESFRANRRKAFNGLCLLVVRATETPESVTIEAASEALQSAHITITTLVEPKKEVR